MRTGVKPAKRDTVPQRFKLFFSPFPTICMHDISSVTLVNSESIMEREVFFQKKGGDGKDIISERTKKMKKTK